MSASKTIKSLIQTFPKSRIFFTDDFSDLGTSESVRKTLERLCDEKMIVRLAYGIYLYPKVDNKWGVGIIYPSLDAIAKAVAERSRCRISPTGTTALNALGLSPQLPANVVYYTDGSPRSINIGNGKGITFKRSTDMKRFSFHNGLMQTIVAAIREIGNGKITEEERAKISILLKEVPMEEFAHDAGLAPAWVQKLLKNLR